MVNTIESGGPLDPSLFVTTDEDQPLTLNPLGEDSITNATSFFNIGRDENGNLVLEPTDRMTISQFSESVVISINNSHDAIRRGDLADLIADSKLRLLQLAQSLMALLALIQLSSDIAGKITTLKESANTHINDMKGAISDYNSEASADATQLTTLNLAIDAYNAGTISEAEYNQAVTDYNNYANGRNDAYNTAVATYQSGIVTDNASIDEINAAISAYNSSIPEGSSQQPLTTLPLITQQPPAGPLLPLATPSAAIPVAHLTAPAPLTDNLAPLSDPAYNQSFSSISEAAFAGTTLLIEQMMQNASKLLDLKEQASEYYHFTLNDKRPFDPAAFNIQAPPTYFQVTGTGGGIGGATLLALSGNPQLAGDISNATFTSSQQLYQRILTGYAQAVQARVGLIASITAVQTLGVDGIVSPFAERAFGTINGLTNAQMISDLIADNFTRDAVQILLGDNATQEEIDSATAQLNGLLLESSLLSGAISSNNPDLVTQVNANVDPSVLAQSAERSFSDVTRDLTATLFTKSALVLELNTKAQLSDGQKQAIISNAIDQAAGAKDADAYRQIITDNLTENNVVNADEIATEALRIAQGEQNTQALQNNNLFDTGKLTIALENEGVGTTTASQVARVSVTQNANNAFEVQYTLESLLEQQGQNPAIAQRVVANLNTPLPPPSIDTLSQTIYNNTYATVLPVTGDEYATSLANRAVENYISGPNSVYSQLLETQKSVNQSNLADQESFQNLLREHQAPNIELFSQNARISDPGRTFLHSAATGLMNKGMAEPENYKKSIDLLV